MDKLVTTKFTIMLTHLCQNFILTLSKLNCPQVPPPEKKQRKETLLSAELGKYVDKKVRVKFQGGREGMYE